MADGTHPNVSVVASIDSNILEEVVNHVFLPPKLPSNAPDEDNERQINILMLEETYAAARTFRTFLPHNQRAPWTKICRMISWLKQTVKAPLEAKKLSMTLESMEAGGACHFGSFLS